MAKKFAARYVLGILTAASVLGAVAGCGTKQTAGSATQSNASQSTGARKGSRTFQPSFQLTTSPIAPTAGKSFTLTISMQRSGGFAGTGGNGSHKPGSFTNSTGATGSGHRHFSHSGNDTGSGNFGGSGNQVSGGGSGNGARRGLSMNAVISGNGVNKVVPLTFKKGQFTGTATVTKAGTYTLSVSMNLGPRQVKKSFTIKIS